VAEAARKGPFLTGFVYLEDKMKKKRKGKLKLMNWKEAPWALKLLFVVGMIFGGQAMLRVLMVAVAAGGNWIPGTRAARIALANKWKGWFADFAVSCNIPAAIVTAFEDALTDLIEKNAAEVSVDSSANKLAAKNADKLLREKMRFIKKHYLLNPPLTDEQLAYLGVLPEPRRTDPIPPAQNAAQVTNISSPSIHIVKVSLAMVGVIAAGYKRIWYKYRLFFCIVDPNALTPTNSKGWTYSKVIPTTKGDFTNSRTTYWNSVIFDCPEEDRGKPMYFLVCLENHKSEDGPFGPIMFCYIP
jgi:hypothetical protein